MTEPGRTGTQAMDAAWPVLHQIAASPGPVALSDLAQQTGMSASKVHRYLASFVRAGLVVQEAGTRRYDLGPFAAQLGLSALARHAFVNRAADDLAALSEATGLTAMISVWGNQGATIVRWHRAAGFAATSFGLGSTLPLLGSSTGRLFLAFMPQALIRPHLEREIAAAREVGSDLPDRLDTLVADIRRTGLAAVDGRFIPGLRAVAAPVLNWQDEIEAAVTLIGTGAGLLNADSPASAHLTRFARAHSVRDPRHHPPATTASGTL